MVIALAVLAIYAVAAQDAEIMNAQIMNAEIMNAEAMNAEVTRPVWHPSAEHRFAAFGTVATHRETCAPPRAGDRDAQWKQYGALDEVPP